MSRPWWERALPAVGPAGLALDDDWVARRVPAGLWLHRLPFAQTPTADSPAADLPTAGAERIAPDRERLTVAVDAERASPETLRPVAAVLATLPPDAPRLIRLVLPLADPELGQDLARRLALDLVAPAGHVVTGQDGLTVVFGFHSDWPDAFWQWRRFRPGRSPEPGGAVYPSPAWEAALTAVGTADARPLPSGTVAKRIPAGFVLREPGQPALDFLRSASYLRPDPARLVIATQVAGENPLLLTALDELLSTLPGDAIRRIRLVWDCAGLGDQHSLACRVALRHGIEVTAPDGELRGHGAGALIVRGPSGPGHWLRFEPGMPPVAEGPVFSHQERSGEHSHPAMPVQPAAPLKAEQASEPIAGPPSEPVTEPVTRPVAEPAAGSAAEPETVGAREPVGGPAHVPMAALTPRPARAAAIIPREYRSGAPERQRHRDLLGSRHDTHVVAVSRILAQRPALRGVLSTEPEDDVATDLAAVRAYLCGELDGVDAALRGHAAGEDADGLLAHARCVVSGLRHLPAQRGTAYRNARLDEAALAEHYPGRVLTEPAFTSASTRPLGGHGGARYVIWSQTGRRTAALEAGGAADEVIFTAGAAFTVLDVQHATSAGAATLIYLRERTHSASSPEVGHGDAVIDAFEPLDDSDRQLLERLRTAAAGASEPEASQAADRQAGHELPIGLDLDAAAQDEAPHGAPTEWRVPDEHVAA